MMFEDCIETTWDDPKWEFVVVTDGKVGMTYRRGSFNSIEGHIATIYHERTVYNEVQEAQELRELLETWRDRGRDNLADAVLDAMAEGASGYPVWDLFQGTPISTERDSWTLELNRPDLKFYRPNWDEDSNIGAGQVLKFAVVER